MATERADVSPIGERVLVRAPVGRDAALVCQVLALNDVRSVACSDMHALVKELHAGAGAALLTEEALAPAGLSELAATLRSQPAWSDLPVIVLIGYEPLASATSDALHALMSAGNLTVLERPVLGLSLVTAVEAALRARRRQYAQRELIEHERAARSEAQAALQTRDEFLATISHELRTPLSAIVLWSHLIEREQLNPSIVQQGFPALARSADALSKLIEDLLDMSRIMSGTLHIDVRSVDLDQVACAAVDVVRPIARDKNIELQVELGAGGVIRADPDRLQQVLWNLLSNSIKFTPPGGRVSVRSSRSEGVARIEVADTGKGIDPQFLPHVFEHFRQAETTAKRREGGLGLGLAISRQLVQLHGGTIRAESPGEGRGAVFTIELPVSSEAASEAQEPATAATAEDASPVHSLAGVRVLLVEDDQSTRAAIGSTLERHGARVLAAETGQRALEVLAAATEEGEPPHVLIADLGLPAMDGYELLQRIRSFEQAREVATLPAALITGYVSARDRERAVAAGFRAYLPKPIEPERLLSVVDELAGISVGRR